MARTDPQVNIRIPSALKERLEDVAGESGRSLTAEIVHRLELSFERPNPAPGSLGLRADLAARREINQSTVEMLMRSVNRLDVILREGGSGPYPGKNAGKSAQQALQDAQEALEVFRGQVEAANLILSEIAIAEATGAELEIEDVRQYAKDRGLI
ncbi:Arc family DNA-binding protein [Stenotrophomonas sp. A3_2]|uniref:Arc family DNA-binding protein n=1 Tax=Stenotrophomonas sp. A3_2 TaxID=3119978 RepID=UPI002FC28393